MAGRHGGAESASEVIACCVYSSQASNLCKNSAF